MVLLFIGCNVAALLLNVFEVRLGEILGPYINYVVDASNVLVVFNSSCNFVIYVTFSLAFRRTLRRYIFKTSAKSTVPTNSKLSKATAKKITTTATRTTFETIRNINLCVSKYGSSNSRSYSDNNSSSNSSKSNSTIVIANENTTNYSQHYHQYYQHQCLEHVKQSIIKKTINHIPKRAQLEILI